MDKKKVIYIKFYPWDSQICIELDDPQIKPGDWIIVKSETGHMEAAPVEKFAEVENENDIQTDYAFARMASVDDLEKVKEKNQKKQETLADCKKLIKKHDLPMKLVDCQYSFDGGKLTFAFTSESRVDFRDLVKELTRFFQKTIRLQQIGSRDETKQLGQLGPCGRHLCCSAFLDELGNITTDLARLQQVDQRGSDRLSGACSRLKCCLNYELDGYENYSTKLPPVDSEYKTRAGQKGKVIDRNILRHSVDIRLEDGTRVTEKFECGHVGCPGCKYKSIEQV